MQDIYDKAQHTIILLGAPTDVTASARTIEWLESLLAYGSPQDWIGRNQDDQVNWFWSNASWDDFCDMVMQPWHRRRWIVQEAALSRDPWIIYGSEVMRWARFTDGVQCAAYLYSARVQRPHFAVDNVRNCDVQPVLSITGLRMRHEPPALIHLLHMFRRNDCSIPQDRITALLGLCSEEERARNLPAAMTADTESGLRDTLLNFAVSHIAVHRNLDVLCLATEAGREERGDQDIVRGSVTVRAHRPDFPKSVYLQSLPTWCPNVTSPHSMWTFGHEAVVFRESPKPYFRASLDLQPSIDLQAASTTGILKASGIELDQIVAFEPTTPCSAPDYNDPSSNFWLACALLGGQHCLAACGSFTAYITAFFRTIGAGARRADTKDVLSDAHLRASMYEFFQDQEIGHQMRKWDVPRAMPERQNHHVDPAAHERYGQADVPVMSRQYMAMARFACTDKRSMALVPAQTEIGDCICILFGCSSPLLLTKEAATTDHKAGFQVRGEVYMDCVMYGEACTDGSLAGSSVVVFDLV